MDHLPIPDHCKKRQMAVPRLNAVHYDRKGLYGFLGRLGYKPPELLAMLNNGNKRRTAESIPIDLDRFVDIGDQGGRTLTSRHWPEFSAQIASKESPFTEEQHGRLEAALNYVVEVLTWFIGSFDQWYTHLTPSVFFSIFILTESLYEALRLPPGRNTHNSTAYMSPSPGKFFPRD
ncbi:hypothetical protein OQA88_9915 [Cercophora sp. LCS_1]